MKKERVILGKNCSYSADSKITGVNNNRVIVGGSGCGKTVSILEPELLELLRAGSSNMIVVATKRRLIDKYRNPLKNAGYTVYDLNFAEPEKSNCCYDPLKYTKTEEDITDLASAIVLANAKKATRKWTRSGMTARSRFSLRSVQHFWHLVRTALPMLSGFRAAWVSIQQEMQESRPASIR